MKSFRTEIENPIVAQDIIELERKIALFKKGEIDEERFRSLRLARGVYGQRQPGVQMIRIKLPFGFLNAKKLRRICSVSEEYSRGRLHITTRQDIQIHHVNLDRTPELWAELEKDEVTLREACGNTVRNITASETSGIDLNEPFDPRPYAEATFKYFLRNPICQEMGRKFKISFSNTDQDTGLAFMHDMGFIAKSRGTGKKMEHGFAVWIGGGLGSQSHHAHLYSDFVPANEIIPLTEAALRIFERHGERSRRMKARLKFLVKAWGFDKFKEALDSELANMAKTVDIEYTWPEPKLPETLGALITETKDADGFKLWKSSNVFKQNNGLFAIGVKVRLGDVFIDQARSLADWIEQYAGDEITLSINQDLIIRHVPENTLLTWYENLKGIGLATAGYNTFSDITACPGTDTCNLGIASSTALANVLETVLDEEYPEFASDPEMNIKMSGCMNACGQHMISTIGFQGMSMKSKDKKVLPATQILLGGGRLGDGKGRFADKVIKLPAKKTPDALRKILDDFKSNRTEGLHFLDYYDSKGEKYFYELLKEFTDLDKLVEDDFIDWGHAVPYIKAIGVGECAGVVIDLISTLFFETEEKLALAVQTLEGENYRDSIYHSYAAILNTAKALLISEEHKTNTQVGIIANFDEHFVDTQKIKLKTSFSELALKMKTGEPTVEFAASYLDEATAFYQQADQYRKKDLES